MNHYYQYYLFFFCLSFVFIGAQNPENIIENFSVKNNRIDITINKDFKKKFLKQNFWAVYDEDIDLSQLDTSVLVLPFIANVISIIWISGKTYYIDSLDKDFYDSLAIVKEIFKRMYPDTKWHGELVARKLVKNSPESPHSSDYVALLFSGGLDSITSSLFHREKKQLLITVNGHWDLPLWDKQLLRERKKRSYLMGNTQRP